MMFRKFLLFTFVISLVYKPSTAQSLSQNMDRAMRIFLRDEQLSHASASFTLLNAQNGKEIFSFNETSGLSTASTLKTITAATAFQLLGKDFTYQTALFYHGKIIRDTLYGDIIIQGSGDPTLGSWRYEQTKSMGILSHWVQAIQEVGIKYIKGKIVGDASLFDSQTTPNGWSWQDMGNYYGAGASALTWHENQYDLHLRPGTHIGDAAKIQSTSPDISQLQFINELKTGSKNSGDQTYIYTAPYSHTAYVRGTAPAAHPHFKVSGSVPNPPLFAALQLKKALQKAGIATSEPAATTQVKTLSKKNLNLLATHTSPPLSQIVYWFLKKSINLYGEHLIKTIASETGNEGSTYQGIKKEKELWADKGIDPEALHIIDGSGLSPQNKVSTKAMATILFQIQKENWFTDFYKALPVIHHIHMKSGHISRVAAYSGYIKSADGTPMVFSFMVNNYNKSGGSISSKIFHLLDQMKQ